MNLPNSDSGAQRRRVGHSAMVIYNVSTQSESHPTTPILMEEEEDCHDLMNIMIIHGMDQE